ncbi:MAG: conserved membrane protein of unknown function [Candidatus Thorarchaeota archaeon]|nr:MAG: conserved membrane protein of unknown function [Candidatus Thorarchaeota archaeon]
MVNYRRLGISIVLGAVLGVLCIIGVGSRLPGGYIPNIIFLIGMWYNRVIMGLVIGLADDIMILRGHEKSSLANAAIRGLIFGILVSSAIFLSTEFRDLPSLFAGFAYGIIIDAVGTSMSNR